MRDRLSFDDYYMIMALWSKVRSPDESTQHGCIIVGKDGSILSWGYKKLPGKAQIFGLPVMGWLMYNLVRVK